MKRLRYRLEPMTEAEEGLIKARDWNELVRFLRRNQLRHAAWMEEGGAGHDWETAITLRDGSWVATVRPGFVNGRPPVVLSSGERVSLLDGPELPVRGLAPVSVVDIPKWFQDRWPFREPAKLRPTTEGGLQRIADPGADAAAEEAGGYRMLWSAAVWLRIHRPRVVVQAGLNRLFLTIAPPLSDSARVFIGSEEAEVIDDRTLVEGFRDDGLESVKLATIYLLSPGGVAETAEPDETWAPYVEHHEFYSLRSQSVPPRFPDGGLDTGVPYTLRGSEIVFAILEDRSRQISEIAALAAANRVRHEFWSV
jgi:hypothetical protein